MKKIIIAFTAGQTLQIVILVVGMAITYTANLLIFCATAGIVATLMMLVGSVLPLIDMASGDEFDEVPPLPKEIKVSNEKIERVPTEEATVEKLFERKKAKE